MDNEEQEETIGDNQDDDAQVLVELVDLTQDDEDDANEPADRVSDSRNNSNSTVVTFTVPEWKLLPSEPSTSAASSSSTGQAAVNSNAKSSAVCNLTRKRYADTVKRFEARCEGGCSMMSSREKKLKWARAVEKHSKRGRLKLELSELNKTLEKRDAAIRDRVLAALKSANEAVGAPPPPPDPLDLEKMAAENRAQKRLMWRITPVSEIEVFQGNLEPTSIFPEEVWGEILSLVNTTDRLNVCRSNSEMDLMFGQAKSSWLFDKVLPQLMKYFSKRSLLLKCRLVCKHWRVTVDNFLQAEHPSRRPFKKDHFIDSVNAQRAAYYSSLRRWQLEHVQFTPNNMNKFLSVPDPITSSSSFRPVVVIGRAVSLQINGLWDEPILTEFLCAAETFLKLYGGGIWHFKFVQYNILLTCERFYSTLWTCLSFLPNIRTLEIKCHLDKVYHGNYRDINAVFSAQPLPNLPRLHCMEIEGVPRQFQEKLIRRYSRQLDKLSLDMDPSNETFTFPSGVKDVFVRRISSPDQFGKLYFVFNTANKLNKLTLDLSLCNRIHGGSLIEILKQLPSISHFRIILHARTNYVSVGSIASPGNKVPTVEYFEIEGDGRDLFYYSTLLYAFPSLKYLHFRDTSYPGNNGDRPVRKLTSEDDNNVEIERYILENSVHKSPIWNTLPHLKILTFESVNGSLRCFCNRETAKYLRAEEMKNLANSEPAAGCSTASQ